MGKKGELIGQGRTAEIFQWGEGKILKLFRKDMPQKLANYEYEKSLIINNKIENTPKVYELMDEDGRNGIVYEQINGKTMMQILASKPLEVKKQAKIMAELHKSIQIEVDFKLPQYKENLKYNISRTTLLSEKIKTNLYLYIEELPDDNILCHGDFHPDNVIITEDNPIIIDWMTASKGSATADIARTSIILKYSDIPIKSYFKKKVITFIRKKFLSEYMKHYIRISGENIKQIEKWELPIAAARLSENPPEVEAEALLNFINIKIKNKTKTQL